MSDSDDRRRLLTMLCLSVTYRFPPDRVEDVIAMLVPMAQASRREPGCRLYVAHQSTTEPATFLFYEQYDDEAALEAHRATAHFTRYIREGVLPIALSREAALYRPIMRP